MTDAYNQPPTPDPEKPGAELEPTGKFEVPPSGGASWVPPTEPHTPPAGWVPSGAGWTAPDAGWMPPGAGWVPPGAGWVPPGAGWVPPGAGWVPPGSGWTPLPTAPTKPHRSRAAVLAVVVAMVVLLIGGGIGYAVRGPSSTSASSAARLPSGSGSGSSGDGASPFGYGTSGSGYSTSGTGSGSGGSTSSSAGSPSDISSIAAGVDPELVDINTTMKDEDEEAAGTGMVLTSTGEVLTNNHVIEEATTISATDIGNGKTYTASVVGYDRTDDVAVIQLHDASGLKTVSIGNSSSAATGEAVVGIGNAGGVGGTPSTAGGSITALDQSITASDDGDGTSEKLTGLIESNCNIEPGDSGGPLVNSSGKVIGMDTAASESSGGDEGGFTFDTKTASSGDQGYSIAINEAITLAKKIEAGSGSSTIHIGTTAFLGVEISATASTTSSSGTTSFGGFGGFGTNGTRTTTGSSGTTTTSGADVAGVVAGTPATSAGLAKGDVITTFGGTAITSATSLTSVINGYHPGDKVKVTWVSSSGQQSATVTLANGPAA